MDRKMVSIVTVNYNGYAVTCEMIESIFRYVTTSFEIIVVDNASEKDEARMLQIRYPEVKVYRSNINLGFAGGNNLGIREAQGDYILLLNNDTTVDCDFLKPMIDRFKIEPQAGIVCPKIRFEMYPDVLQFAGYTPLSRVTLRNYLIGFMERDEGQYDIAHTTPFAHGAAMMLKREVIEKAGLMAELYFLYYEELDWSVQITKADYEIWYEPQSVVYHKESASTGQNSPLRCYYLSRNRLLYAKRNCSGIFRPLSIFYQMTVVFLRDVIRYAFIGRSDLLKAVCLGVWDGLKNIRGEKPMDSRMKR
ncbi:glycosyltransferase family 2 protein [Coprobacter sp.]